MEIYAYLNFKHAYDIDNQKHYIKFYAKRVYNFEIPEMKKTTINKILKYSKPNDNLIVYDLTMLGSTTYTILNNILKLLQKGLNIHLVREDFIIENNRNFDIGILSKILNIEEKNAKKRVSLAKQTCKNRGKSIGRQKGAKIKSIFDKHKKTILKLSKLKVPMTVICKEIGVGTPAGLDKYIKRLIEEEKEKQRLLRIKESEEIEKNANSLMGAKYD